MGWKNCELFFYSMWEKADCSYLEIPVTLHIETKNH